jgi:hypothetical protein
MVHGPLTRNAAMAAMTAGSPGFSSPGATALTFDVELVGDVGADRERGPACGEDLLDDAVRCTLVPDVADDNGVAPVRELAHNLPADTPRSAR